MAQIFLNFAVAILIAAFLTTTVAALYGQDRAVQKVPVKANGRRRPNT